MGFARLLVSIVVTVGMTVVGGSVAQAAGPVAGHVAYSTSEPPVAGRTVSTSSGGGLGLVIVVVYAEDYSTFLGWDITDLSGRFSVDGVDHEEVALRFIGTLVGHETGWLACDRSVVPTSGEACTSSPGDHGDVRLDRL